MAHLELVRSGKPRRKRRPLSLKLRFLILKRDVYTCQYCGRKAPNVELHVDHLNPIAKGGTDDPANLVTSCVDCNSGKGTVRELSPEQRERAEEIWEMVAASEPTVDALEAFGITLDQLAV